jgi:hypothetical protein
MYPSDLTEAQWEILASHWVKPLPTERRRGRLPKQDCRAHIRLVGALPSPQSRPRNQPSTIRSHDSACHDPIATPAYRLIFLRQLLKSPFSRLREKGRGRGKAVDQASVGRAHLPDIGPSGTWHRSMGIRRREARGSKTDRSLLFPEMESLVSGKYALPTTPPLAGKGEPTEQNKSSFLCSPESSSLVFLDSGFRRNDKF